MSARGFAPRLAFMAGGFLVWAVHFGVIYGFNALACARTFAGQEVWGIGIVPFVVVATTALAVAATIAVLVAALWRRGPARVLAGSDAAEFMRYTTISVAALSIVAILWDALPALIVPPCA